MYAEKTFLAIIPARGGSKGIPGKNIRMLAGKPLLVWTIEAARQSKYVDRLILSSDDNEIITVAARYGCEAPFIRPAELAMDDTPGIAPVFHAIETLPEKYDYVVLLQPTSPLRSSNDIDACIEQCVQHNAPACVSVTEVKDNPFWMFQLEADMKMRPLIEGVSLITRRQDLPSAYALNGAVYVAQTSFIMNSHSFITDETVAYVMPLSRSADIDEEDDFERCEWLMRKREEPDND